MPPHLILETKQITYQARFGYKLKLWFVGRSWIFEYEWERGPSHFNYLDGKNSNSIQEEDENILILEISTFNLFCVQKFISISILIPVMGQLCR